MTPDDEALRRECEKLVIALGLDYVPMDDEEDPREQFDKGDMEKLMSFAQAQRAAGRRQGLEEAAKRLQDEADECQRVHGEHQFCEDYSCHYLTEEATKLRAEAEKGANHAN